jgi:hypothetical protein
MPVRVTRSRAPTAQSRATLIVPDTAGVRPTRSLLMPKALSRTRNPATDPGATVQVPLNGPAGAAAAAGSISGAGAAGLTTNQTEAAPVVAMRDPATAMVHAHQRRVVLPPR